MVVRGVGFAFGGNIFKAEAYFGGGSVYEWSSGGVFQGVRRGRRDTSWRGRFSDSGQRFFCGKDSGINIGARSVAGCGISIGDKKWFAESVVGKLTGSGAHAYCGGVGGAPFDLGGSGEKGFWANFAICRAVFLGAIHFILYGDGGVDAVDYAGGDNGDFEFAGVVRREKNCALAVDFDGGGVDVSG